MDPTPSSLCAHREGLGGVRVCKRFVALLAIACGLLGLTACPGSAGTAVSTFPEASLYDREPSIEGEWLGEVGGVLGTLEVGELESYRYFGAFRSDDGRVEYTMLVEQVRASPTDGSSRLGTNQYRYTWQDGVGGRGRGYVLINREETGLTGSFGYGEDIIGLGSWTFIRVDD